VSQKIARLILPFSVLSENRTESFSEEREKAVLYCFAELERKKGGGVILRKTEEKLAFLAEVCYPLWLIPWSGFNLLFDGLKGTAYTLTYRNVPNVKTFMENSQRSSKTLETHMTFLSDNVNYFQAPGDEKSISIDALITEPNLLSEFNLYIGEVNQFEASSSRLVLLQPTIDETSISSITQELEDLKSGFKQDVDGLYESMKLLNKTTRNFVKTIRNKVETVKEEFEEEIKKQEGIVTPKVNHINEEYDEQTTKLTKDFENQLLPLQKEKVKLEKTKEQTLQKIEQYNIEAKTCAASKDVVGERKWKEKTNETKKEFSEIEVKLEELEEKIKKMEEDRTLETFRLRSEWEAKTREAKKDLLELEASRDTEIQIHMQEIEKLESLTAPIIQQIDNMAKLREANLADFEKLEIQRRHKNTSLLYVPFYLACYQAELKKRYVLFPPSVANSIRFTTKLKGVLGKTKVKQLLVPRFKNISSFLNKFLELIKQNAVFEREIYEAGDKADMLKSSSVQKQISSELKQLKEEGWFSEKEYEAFAGSSSKT
jgi:DNA repair exonuclease SbcCD ATPase subunit